jgi:branched-subunit amino acid transport protein
MFYEETDMNLWLVVVGMGLITYGIRLSMIVLLERVHISALVRQALRFVPAAVLSAIIFPEVLQPGGALDLSLGNARLLAGVVAAVIAWRTGNVLLTIGIGMGVLWLLQAIN